MLYAGCSCLRSIYFERVWPNWSYSLCSEAANKNAIKEFKDFYDEELSVYAFLLYDSSRDWIVLSFRATVC